MKQSEPHDAILLQRVPTSSKPGLPFGTAGGIRTHSKTSMSDEDDEAFYIYVWVLNVYGGITDHVARSCSAWTRSRTHQFRLKPNKVKQADFNTRSVVSGPGSINLVNSWIYYKQHIGMFMTFVINWLQVHFQVSVPLAFFTHTTNIHGAERDATRRISYLSPFVSQPYGWI